MASFWAKMPCGWQQQPHIHKALRDAPVGDAIAALKLYLALCMLANYGPTPALPIPGSVKQSLVVLGRKIGMTKPLVIRGGRLLETVGLVTRLAGKPVTYVLADYITCTYWTKIPKRYLLGSDVREIEHLVTLPNRGQEVFEALQLYIYIAAIRDKHTLKAKATYDTITTVLGMSRNAVSRAITTLCARNLISMRPGEALNGVDHSNTYWLQGRIEEASSAPAAAAAIATVV